MQSILSSLSGEFAYALCWTLIHSLWQFSLIGLLLAAVLGFGKALHSSTRYLAALVALFVCAAWSVTTFAKYYSVSVSSVSGPIFLQSINLGENNSIWVQFTTLINSNIYQVTWAWLLGFVFYFALDARSFYFCQLAKRQSVSNIPERWVNNFVNLCDRLELDAKHIQLKISEHINFPCVVGHLKPAVLIPAAFLSGLDRQQFEAIILHELAHIKRNDYLINLLQSLIKTLFFFNPVLLWISHKMDVERENACDDIAVTLCGDPMLYANSLMEIAEMNNQPNSFTMSVSGKQKSLLVRVKRLFEGPSRLSGTFEKFLSASFVALSLVAVSVYAGIKKEESKSDANQDRSMSALHMTADLNGQGVEKFMVGFERMIKESCPETDDIVVYDIYVPDNTQKIELVADGGMCFRGVVERSGLFQAKAMSAGESKEHRLAYKHRTQRRTSISVESVSPDVVHNFMLISCPQQARHMKITSNFDDQISLNFNNIACTRLAEKLVAEDKQWFEWVDNDQKKDN